MENPCGSGGGGTAGGDNDNYDPPPSWTSDHHNHGDDDVNHDHDAGNGFADDTKKDLFLSRTFGANYIYLWRQLHLPLAPITSTFGA